jgi:signal transduction histidine kinase
LSAGLIAVAMLSTPAMAGKNSLVKRHVAEKANARASAAARHIHGYARIPAPHVISPAWCDVGDNPFMCRIDVYDTGIGIAIDRMPRMFEAFTRLDPARCDGLGIGLFIVRQAIGILGHRIDVASTPYRGSRFSISANRAEKK